jgi:hypothetical protein
MSKWAPGMDRLRSAKKATLNGGWFGSDWGAPACTVEAFVPTPVGARCLWCEEPITADDRGFMQHLVGADGGARPAPIHLECQVRQISGGVNHIRRRCSSSGGSAPADPPGLSKREAAIAAYHAWRQVSSQ